MRWHVSSAACLRRLYALSLVNLAVTTVAAAAFGNDRFSVRVTDSSGEFNGMTVSVEYQPVCAHSTGQSKISTFTG